MALKFRPALVLVLGLVGGAFAALSQDQIDSGWVSIFDGKSFDGWWISTTMDPDVAVDSANQDVFTVKDGAIHASGIGPNSGHIRTTKYFSHYHMRLKIRFDKPEEDSSKVENAGVLYHARKNETSLGVYPHSIEFQGKKSGFGELWAIGNVWVTTTVENKNAAIPKYKVGGVTINYGAESGTKRQIMGDTIPYRADWNTMELFVRGGDSSAHVVNGITVLKAKKLRTADKNSPTDFSHPLKSGAIALQSEGQAVAYKDIEIMELDSITGKPLYAKTTAVLPSQSAPGLHFSAWPALGGVDARYQLPAVGKFDLEIDALSGECVRKLPLDNAATFFHWDGKNNQGISVPAGAYVFRLRQGTHVTALAEAAVLP